MITRFLSSLPGRTILEAPTGNLYFTQFKLHTYLSVFVQDCTVTRIVQVSHPDSPDSPEYPDPNPGQSGSPIADQFLSVLISDLAYSLPLGIFRSSQLVSEQESPCLSLTARRTSEDVG